MRACCSTVLLFLDDEDEDEDGEDDGDGADMEDEATCSSLCRVRRRCCQSAFLFHVGNDAATSSRRTVV